MRLSIEPDRDDERSLAVLHAALDAGVTLLDTADSYCWTDDDIGHNERLIARALATWPGDRSRITVATKGGVTRPEGRWEIDGRAKHLVEACERSCRALGVDRIALYQLHAPDPATPFATSVRALAKLKRDGLIASIGLSNVTVGQIEEARRMTEIDAIQVELSIWHDAALLSGVAEYCVANRLPLLAYRPLGGRKARARTAADPLLNEIASRHGATPFEIALAWLRHLSSVIVPLPGITRIETAQSVARAFRIALTDEDRRALDDRIPAARVLRRRPFDSRVGRVATDPLAQGEVVLIMGLPGAGKSTLAASYVSKGYQRLNRDDAGGTLRDLLPALDRALAAGATRLVLDNTYASRKSRAEVIRAAAERGAAVRCVWVATTVDDAQVNAVWRIVSRYGKLPDEDELAALRTHDVSAFTPSVLFRYQRELEPPDPAEGFSRIDRVPFARTLGPEYTNRAVIAWCDDVLVRSRTGARTPVNPDDVLLVDECAARLRAYQDDGWPVLGMSWQPEIAAGTRTPADVEAVFARVKQLAGLAMEIAWCPHAAGPPRCWCRKPLPGLGVVFVQRHKLDPSQCLYIGGGVQDPGFARKLGFSYRAAAIG
jgi:aryl-alcohol dehydrogenase-like predicted oxidoreductase/histidinol phosphatase-like enzyme/predicted kinase